MQELKLCNSQKKTQEKSVYDIEVGSDFLPMTPKAEETKEKNR